MPVNGSIDLSTCLINQKLQMVIFHLILSLHEFCLKCLTFSV
uniref:Rab3 GTPase-activating protein catalytic subunit isoform X2 n=1 Tax=Rhizophora mucronata TaxID=61149 RepID=A0A2P2M4S0_RHIMU